MSIAQTISADGSRVDGAVLLPEPGLLLPAMSLCKRELVRFLRQRHRIIGALATPVVFWLLIGGGMGREAKFGAEGGQTFIQYFFPGTLVMILLFTAIFSTISIIEDRREGFLQSVLVAPVSRQAVVLGKVLGGTVLASGQGALFLLFSPLVGFHYSFGMLLLTLVLMVVISFALTALGFCIAWRMSSTQGFHAIMNLFLMPMWFLSGALFPADKAWWGLKWVMRINPLTYGLDGLRGAMSGGGRAWMDLAVMAVFGVVLCGLAGRIARKNVAGDLQ